MLGANPLAARAPEAAYGQALQHQRGGGADQIIQLLGLVERECGASVERVHTPPREGDIRCTRADISLAGELLGYSARVWIEGGLRRTVPWLKGSVGD